MTLLKLKGMTVSNMYVVNTITKLTKPFADICLFNPCKRESKGPNKRGNECPERTSDLPKIIQLESNSQDPHPGSQFPALNHYAGLFYFYTFST